MDNYGIINIDLLDRRIESYRIIISGIKPTNKFYETYVFAMKSLQKTKEECLELPNVQQVFDQGMFIQRRGTGYGEEKLRNANDFIANYKP